MYLVRGGTSNDGRPPPDNCAVELREWDCFLSAKIAFDVFPDYNLSGVFFVWMGHFNF